MGNRASRQQRQEKKNKNRQEQQHQQQQNANRNMTGEEKMEVVATGEVDEKLYSRQLYVMGHEAQRRMMASRAILFGLSGLGAEVAKNCILAGISSLTLCDPSPVTSYDLGGNFYLTEADIGTGKSRAELSRDKLAELNQYVDVKVAENSPASLTNDNEEDILNLIQDVSVVIITVPLSRQLVIAINNKCRSIGASFIYATTTGLFSKIFCDFGSSFVVADKDGEQPASSQIENILPSNPATVKVLEDHGRHGLETGDFVTLARVKGMKGVFTDSTKEYEVKSTGAFTFELVGLDLSECGEPATQGYINQVKKPVTLSFKKYEDALEDPGDLMMSDFAKFDRPALLHLAYKALDSYLDKYSELPEPGNVDMAKELIGMAKSLDNSILADNENAERILMHFASGSRAVLSPMCAAIGGIVGQEVLKACSGKFSPIQGFLYFDGDEALPDALLPAEDLP